MKITYDHKVDALYIQLTDKPNGGGKRITENFVLDFDEDNEVRGIEILNVRTLGIDAFSVNVQHYAVDHDPSPLTEAEKAAIEAGSQRRKQRFQNTR